MREDATREAFVAFVRDLAARPFPERYLAYRRARPDPYRAPPMGRISNDENVALILVMSENFPLFGVKRIGAILKWPNIQVHHILQHGLASGRVAKATDTMYQSVNGHALLASLAPR